MKIKTLLIALPVLATLLPLTAQAKPINHRQHHQNSRIEAGERNNSLTNREAETLEAREARTAREEAHDRHSGGKFTPSERRDVQHDLNSTNRAIYRQKHDAQGTRLHAPINGRQRYQNTRIEQGEHSGQLTNRESERLEAREARLRRAEARDRKSGGELTRAERRQLQHRLNNTNHAIYHQKHDAQNR